MPEAISSRRRTNKLGTSGKPIQSALKAVEILNLLNRTELNSVQHISVETRRYTGTMRAGAASIAPGRILLDLPNARIERVITGCRPSSRRSFCRFPDPGVALAGRHRHAYSSIPFSLYAQVASTMNKRLSPIGRAHAWRRLARGEERHGRLLGTRKPRTRCLAKMGQTLISIPICARLLTASDSLFSSSQRPKCRTRKRAPRPSPSLRDVRRTVLDKLVAFREEGGVWALLMTGLD